MSTLPGTDSSWDSNYNSHSNLTDPADNHKNVSSCTGGNCQDEEVRKHVDIQWKPLELSDVASFRNGA